VEEGLSARIRVLTQQFQEELPDTGDLSPFAPVTRLGKAH